MIKWLFNVPPKVGSKWRDKRSRYNPYQPKRNTVEVVSTKEGWVEFKYLITNSYSDNCPIRVFRENYRELT